MGYSKCIICTEENINDENQWHFVEKLNTDHAACLKNVVNLLVA